MKPIKSYKNIHEELEKDEGLSKLIKYNKPRNNYEIFDKIMLKNQN
jgi:hypothetical protein